MLPILAALLLNVSVISSFPRALPHLARACFGLRSSRFATATADAIQTVLSRRGRSGSSL